MEKNIDVPSTAKRFIMFTNIQERIENALRGFNPLTIILLFSHLYYNVRCKIIVRFCVYERRGKVIILKEGATIDVVLGNKEYFV